MSEKRLWVVPAMLYQDIVKEIKKGFPKRAVPVYRLFKILLTSAGLTEKFRDAFSVNADKSVDKIDEKELQNSERLIALADGAVGKMHVYIPSTTTLIPRYRGTTLHLRVDGEPVRTVFHDLPKAFQLKDAVMAFREMIIEDDKVDINFIDLPDDPAATPKEMTIRGILVDGKAELEFEKLHNSSEYLPVLADEVSTNAVCNVVVGGAQWAVVRAHDSFFCYAQLASIDPGRDFILERGYNSAEAANEAIKRLTQQGQCGIFRRR